MNQETAIKRAHVALMKHPETALYSGVILMGESSVVDAKFTAYTDGLNKRYSRWFLDTIDKESKKRGLVLHENLHIALKQTIFGKAMFKENPKMANLAADFVVNDVIENIKGTIGGTNERIVELPDEAVYDPMFHDWSMRKVYDYLKKNAKGGNGGKRGQGKGKGSEPPSGGTQNNDDDGDGDGDGDTVTVNGKTYDVSKMDEHDFSELTPEQAQELGKAIEDALREGGLLAGRMGAKVPRVISELLEPKVDWREALREFVSASIRGNDEFTWRKLNKRHIANDFIMPSMENETIGEVVVAIDTSGSIGQRELTEFATELVSICEITSPELVRVLWWDTEVHGEQQFTSQQYNDIAKLLKPKGGGGTRVGCVAEHINKEKINADCVLVFTDGYVESDPAWNIVPPTLWMVTQNKEWLPPSGKKVMVNDEE